MIVNSLEQINALRNAIAKNADASYVSVRKRIEDMTPMQFFASIKFEKLGKDPVGGEPQNLIEQINQTYSDMVVLSAAEDLLNLYPGTSLVLQLGVSSGYDIESEDGTIAAECFAVTTVSCNRKLDKDCKKLLQSVAPIKCVYFYSALDGEEKLQNQYRKYPDIRFKRIIFDF